MKADIDIAGLRACPFCGSAKIVHINPPNSHQYILCQGCYAGGPPTSLVGEAAAWESWNARASAADGADVETWESINRWCDDTFGPATIERTVERAKEEFIELEGAMADPAHAAIEAADVVIILCRIPGFAEALQAKMAINRKREWRTLGDGSGYHVKPARDPALLDAAERVAGIEGAVSEREIALFEALKAAYSWIGAVADCDMDEIVADGGVTAAMVVRQEAGEQARRARQAIDANIAARSALVGEMGAGK